MTDSNDKKPTIHFAPGALDSLEQQMTTEELQEFMDQIKTKIEDGSFLDDSEAIDLEEMEFDDPEGFAQLMKVLENLDDFNPAEMKKKLN